VQASHEQKGVRRCQTILSCDRWERVWHEDHYDLVADCVQPNYIRHDEAGDRTVTREAYAAEIAKAREERPPGEDTFPAPAAVSATTCVVHATLGA
jgi:hypothetical protein